MSYTYWPGAPTVTQVVWYTHMPNRRGEGEVVIIVVDNACCPSPPRAIVHVIIITRSVVAETEIEAVVASVPFAVVRDRFIIAAVSIFFFTLRVCVIDCPYLECEGTHHWCELQRIVR